MEDEMKEKGMTCVEAARILIRRWPVGTEKTGGRIEREIRKILFESNSEEYPSGNTIMRRFRENKPASITSTMHGKDSRYIKQ